MAAARSFEDLIVWQKAHKFVLSVYELSNNFPKSETYGLTSQLRRAAVSIPANIAEGFKKRTAKDKIKFLLGARSLAPDGALKDTPADNAGSHRNIAQGSAEECRYYLILVQDLKYGDTKASALLLEEVSKLLNSYSRKIQENNNLI